MKDFFISYTSSDEQWAEWVEGALKEAGFTTVCMLRDFPPGSNFIVKMHRASSECRRTVLILSPAYLESDYTLIEWAAAAVEDPTGRRGKLLPVRVEECKPTGLMGPMVYCDLVGLEENEARERLLGGARAGGTVDETPPAFPGLAAFPGGAHTRPPAPAAAHSEEARAARELLSVLRTTNKTFEAQCRVRDELYDAVRQRLGVNEAPQYERFFNRFYVQMNGEEKFVHGIVRAYTENILSKQNARALDMLDLHPRLEEQVELLPELRDHLTLWLGKYQSVLKDESACLCYVGVEEGVEFPTGVEQNLRSYLEGLK